MLLPILRVALSVLKMLRWVVLGKENRWQNWEFAVGYDTVQGDTKRLIAVFFKKQKEVNSILSPPSNFWKVGSTSEEAQRKLGTTQPGAARVPEQFIFQNGDKIPVFAAHDLWVEGEFAISIGKNLPPREQPYTYEEVYSAINGVAPSLEFVGSR